MRKTTTTFVLLISLILLAACGSELPEQIEQEMASLPDRVDYNFHVKPILSDRCYACHGPDAQKREANLRFDEEASAYASLESGGRAISPGSIRKSLLVHRILSDDPEESMPPPDSKLTLTDHERALLIKWIDQGAEYKPHWAFSKPEKARVPKTDKRWAKNEIDHFVAEKLASQNLKSAPEAKREQLIRRLYFDLTGLPPSLNELDQWMTDTRDDYYERLVDSLMNLPAYGERMAVHWLDVARFADSEGYLDDFHHEFWPYRDWVIQAFNKNLPYDEFVLWQVGGDQIPEANREQILATAFNRNHKQNSEGGVISEEFRVDYVADRTNTVGAAFMGLTVGCARCHDHKYDPFSQENYYQLFGFFNSTIERGDGIFSNNAIEFGQKVSNEQSMNAGPVLALPDDEVQKVRTYLKAQITQKQNNIQQLASANAEEVTDWKQRQTDASALRISVDQATVSHLRFDDMRNGKTTDHTPGAPKATYWGSIEAVDGIKGKAIRSDAHGQLVAKGESSAFERMQPFTISFWINSPKVFDDAHVLYNGNDRIQGYRGWDIVLDTNRVHFRLNHAHPYQSLDVRTPDPLPVDEWVHFVWTYDGSSRAEGMKVYRNGSLIEVEIERNLLYRSSMPYFDPIATVYKPYKGLIIGNRHYDQDFTGGLLDEVRILNREADELVAAYLYDEEQGKIAFQQALAAQSPQLDRFYDLFIDQELESERMALRAIQAQEIRAIDTVQEIMVMGDWEEERPTYILDRGVYDAYGKQVQKDVPSSILPWPEELPKNRYGLGQWLIHPEHPLTARVAVNQFWYLMFGRGIVETVEDFGNQGALPTHPELLDWLAVDFQENNWDVKRLIRQMVLSATYRQSSRIRPDIQELDPGNYLLARGPRYRRSAEMVRDNVLAASGLLNRSIGGPSAFPYQPDGLWKEVMTHGFFPEYAIDYRDGLYRRSMYTFWKRNMPPPSMLIFDAAIRAECQMRRQRSSTPLQALVLLNDPQMIEGCRVLAENMWGATNGNIAIATSQAFRLLTSREPTQREQDILIQQYEDELAYFQENKEKGYEFLATGHRAPKEGLPVPELAALARVTNTILNSTEAYYKN
ncbi:MAG: DUF1553 domain-containing protein [Bacteroidota bacterium]